MDIEIFPLILGMGVGAVFGARGKGAMKSMAKGYFALIDRAREWSASAREDLRDAVEEARYERTQESSRAEGHTGATEEKTRSRRSSSNGKAPAGTARKRSTTAGTRSRASSNSTRSRAAKSAAPQDQEELSKAA